MGGAAFLLEGGVDDALLRERPLPRTLLDRVLFRTRRQGVTRTTWGETTHLDLPLPEPLRALCPAFKQWLAARLPEGDAAATSVLREYLNIDVCSLYLRGIEQDGRARYHLQLTFTGCAGMGETSAEVAAHWAELWWREARPQIEALCAGSGFAPTGPWIEEGGTAPLFFPLRQGGYASFVDAQRLPPSPSLPPPEGLPWLEVDGALLEQRAGVEEDLAALKPIATQAFAERRCRCALCDPGYRRTDALAL